MKKGVGSPSESRSSSVVYEFCEENSEDGAQAQHGVLSLFTLEYPQFTDSTKQYRIVYPVIPQECNVPPSPTLSFKLV